MAKKMEDNWTGERRIRRLLRHKGSEEYFKDDGWTTNPDEARNFTDELEAVETCARLNLNGVELTLRFDPRASDVFCVTIR